MGTLVCVQLLSEGGFEMWHSSPVLTQAQLTAQELKDLGAVLLVLLCRVGRTNRRHRHGHTRGAGARDQHGQPRHHHHVHPLKRETERREVEGKAIRSATLTTSIAILFTVVKSTVQSAHVTLRNRAEE